MPLRSAVRPRLALPTLALASLLATPLALAGNGNPGFELAVIELVNSIRAENGFAALGNDPRLHASALAHSIDMASHDSVATPCFQHDSCDGTAWNLRIAAYYPASAILGENIASGQTTPQAVVNSWMNSSTGHREAILNPLAQGIGVGYYFQAGSVGGTYWTQDFGSLALQVSEPGTGLAMLAGLAALVSLQLRRRG